MSGEMLDQHGWGDDYDDDRERADRDQRIGFVADERAQQNIGSQCSVEKPQAVEDRRPVVPEQAEGHGIEYDPGDKNLCPAA